MKRLVAMIRREPDRDVARTDAVVEALARREPVAMGADVAVRLLGALIADVENR
jgi:hypothetical protein